MKEGDAGRWQRQAVAVGYCSYATAYPPRVQRGGNRAVRRSKQKTNRGGLRDDRLISRILARSLSSFQGGSDPRTPETTGKLQILQQFAVPSAEKEKTDSSNKDKPIYVGMETQACRVDDKKSKQKKEGDGSDVEEENGIKDKKKESEAAGMNQLNKSIQKVEDGLLLVVLQEFMENKCVHLLIAAPPAVL